MANFLCFRCNEQLARRIHEVLRSRGLDVRRLTIEELRYDGGFLLGALNEPREVPIAELEKEAERTQTLVCKREAAEVRIYIDKPPHVEWYDVYFDFLDGSFRNARFDNRQLFLDLLKSLFREPGIINKDTAWKRLTRYAHEGPRGCFDFIKRLWGA